MRTPRPLEDRRMLEASYEAFNRGDYATLRDLYTEDCVWDMSRTRLAGFAAVFEGHEGIRRCLEEFKTLTMPWEGARGVVDAAFDLGDGRFLIEGSYVLESPAGGSTLKEPFAQLGTVRGGKIARVVMYEDRAQAWREAGVERPVAP
jgi:ketosteroid isomerase-like protein